MQQIKGTKDKYQISLEELTRPVLVKKTARARRMTLRVSHTQRNVVLTIPKHAGWRQAGAFVEKHLDWLKQQLETLPGPVPFQPGAIIPYEGFPHRLHFVGPATKETRRLGAVWSSPESGGEGWSVLNVTGDFEHAPRRLTDWLKKRASERLGESAARHAKRLKLSYTRLSIRDQSSRWGSCSSNGTLSFSWRLIFAPPHILDYVAAHEVAHLAEMNHSPRFWKLVAKTVPNYSEARLWLRRNGQDLHRYGATK